MKIAVRVVLVLSGLFCAGGLGKAPAHAHSWYPKECCNEMDCAPVDSMAQLTASAGLPQVVVTSRRVAAIIPENFPVRQSEDGRMHVCVRQNEFGGWDVMCLFVPPDM